MLERCWSGPLLIAVLCLIFWPAPALAQKSIAELSEDEKEALIHYKHSLVTVQELVGSGLLDRAAADRQQAHYLAKAAAIVGGSMSAPEFISAVEKFERERLRAEPGLMLKIKGFFTFVNVIWLIAIILLITAVGWLIALYVVPVIKEIPATVVEILIYLASLAFIYAASLFVDHVAEYIALTGCLGVVGALSFTHYLHFIRDGRYINWRGRNTDLQFLTVYSAILLVVWSIVAVLYQSTMIGFLAVIALQALIGFSDAIVVLTGVLGFVHEEIAPRTMATSLLILCPFVLGSVLHVPIPYVEVFSSGVLYICTFVYLTGLLIISSKWYRNRRGYLFKQALAIVSGLLFIYIGGVCEIVEMRELGGTFFFEYVLVKYFEFSWQRKRWAWATLGLAVMLYVSAIIMKQYPQYFIFV